MTKCIVAGYPCVVRDMVWQCNANPTFAAYMTKWSRINSFAQIPDVESWSVYRGISMFGGRVAEKDSQSLPFDPDVIY